jgi:5-hydroxyisourate hydrolase
VKRREYVPGRANAAKNSPPELGGEFLCKSETSKKMNSITTHVLDTTRGRPAAGIPVKLDFHVSDQEWKELGRGVTDADGRIRTLMDPGAGLTKGVYRLTFDVESYQRGFYPHVVLVFRVDDPNEHYHVPLLLGTFGYTTYRGS